MQRDTQFVRSTNKGTRFIIKYLKVVVKKQNKNNNKNWKTFIKIEKKPDKVYNKVIFVQ